LTVKQMVDLLISWCNCYKHSDSTAVMAVVPRRWVYVRRAVWAVSQFVAFVFRDGCQYAGWRQSRWCCRNIRPSRTSGRSECCSGRSLLSVRWCHRLSVVQRRQ